MIIVFEADHNRQKGTNGTVLRVRFNVQVGQVKILLPFYFDLPLFQDIFLAYQLSWCLNFEEFHNRYKATNGSVLWDRINIQMDRVKI